MLFHILYRYDEHIFDSIEITNDNQHVIREYHFYSNNDHTHDTRFAQHCFDRIYDSLKSHGIKFNEHWILSYRCVDQLKYSY